MKVYGKGSVAFYIATANLVFFGASHLIFAQEPPPPPPAASPAQTSSNKSEYNPRIPIYQRVKPEWAFEFDFSMRPLGGANTMPGVNPGKLKTFKLSFEYQPQFILEQKYGIIGIGASMGFYPLLPTADGVTKNFLAIRSLGGQARYQLRFFREQPLVPYAGYRMDYWNYGLMNKSGGSFLVKGPFFGGMILLNFIDQDSASEFYVNYEICRSYIIAEYQMMSWSHRGEFSEKTLTAGLRFEL
ncbi:MAG: hypothetical protein A2583_10125 [Bdellovibrionales bacterium RIFOXYD1_FULL_53_11]|nr:MAG: hypothetical protein A2583_10125 [Bdellovibrionales bacterium RIFOXYD1_FULL_53_11]